MDLTDTVKRADDLARKNGMTLFKLCEMNNIPYSTISKAKRRGSNLSVDTIDMICNALNITISEFFKEDQRDVPCEGQLKLEIW